MSQYLPVFGLSSLDGNNGFQINGIAAGDFAGWSVSSAGDLNGDGFDDLIVSARRADPNGTNSGATYVVFGGPTLLGQLDAHDGTADGTIALSSLGSFAGANGFTINGVASSYSVLDYRLHAGRLSAGWLAVLLQPTWAPAIVCAGLSVMLFPDGRLPSPRLRWPIGLLL